MANDDKAAGPSPEELRKEALSKGMWIFLMLATLTFGEFLVAVIAPPWTFVLWVVAAWKTFYVVKDYMHVGKLAGGEEQH